MGFFAHIFVRDEIRARLRFQVAIRRASEFSDPNHFLQEKIPARTPALTVSSQISCQYLYPLYAPPRPTPHRT
jgi:hypothetical protein